MYYWLICCFEKVLVIGGSARYSWCMLRAWKYRDSCWSIAQSEIINRWARKAVSTRSSPLCRHSGCPLFTVCSVEGIRWMLWPAASPSSHARCNWYTALMSFLCRPETYTVPLSPSFPLTSTTFQGTVVLTSMTFRGTVTYKSSGLSREWMEGRFGNRHAGDFVHWGLNRWNKIPESESSRI